LTVLIGPWRAWARFLAAAIALGAPQVLWLSSNAVVSSASFIGWAFGWDRGQQNAVVFWLLNTGAFIPLIAVAAVWRVAGRPLVSPRILRFYLPFAICFLVANVIRLAPWVWDNVKVLVLWWVASAPLVALLLASWLRRPGWPRALATAALLSLTLAGTLDVWRALSGAATAQLFDRPAVAFGKLVADLTEPSATLVHAPVHNHAVFLSGRRSLMGYPGHLWTHGIHYATRQQDILRLYAGAPDARALVDRYRIDYVVVGPDERRFCTVNDTFFSRYPIAGELGEYRLYRVSASRD
jgi:hypothetical protein